MTAAPSHLSSGTNQALTLIDERLVDLRKANDVFREMDWDKSRDIQRNDREIRWLIDLRTILGAAHASPVAAWECRNIGKDGTPFSNWYHTDDGPPTPEKCAWDGYLSYEYRPLYAAPQHVNPAQGSQEPRLGDIVSVKEGTPYFQEWRGQRMQLVSLRIEPSGKLWASLADEKPRHRGCGIYDGETTEFEFDHLEKASSVPSTSRATPIIEPIESVGMKGAQKQAIADHASMLPSTTRGTEA